MGLPPRSSGIQLAKRTQLPAITNASIRHNFQPRLQISSLSAPTARDTAGNTRLEVALLRIKVREQYSFITKYSPGGHHVKGRWKGSFLGAGTRFGGRRKADGPLFVGSRNRPVSADEQPGGRAGLPERLRSCFHVTRCDQTPSFLGIITRLLVFLTRRRSPGLLGPTYGTNCERDDGRKNEDNV